jgi:hypothetical protein
MVLHNIVWEMVAWDTIFKIITQISCNQETICYFLVRSVWETDSKMEFEMQDVHWGDVCER